MLKGRILVIPGEVTIFGGGDARFTKPRHTPPTRHDPDDALSRAFRAFALPAALALVCTTVPTAYASGDDHAWEYEAAFDIQESGDTYSLNMANNADATMKFCFHATDTHDAHGVHKVEDNCHADEASPTAVTANAPAITIVSGTTYQVTMDPRSVALGFQRQVPCKRCVRVLRRAYAVRVSLRGRHRDGAAERWRLARRHRRLGVHGRRARVEENSVGGHDAGLPLRMGCHPLWPRFDHQHQVWELVKPYALMFASGTLLSTAFALVLYESTHLIPIGNDEGLAAGRWTAMILCGFITSPVIAIVLKFFLPQLEKDDEFCEATKPGNTVIGAGNAQKMLRLRRDGQSHRQLLQPRTFHGRRLREEHHQPQRPRAVPHVPHRGRLLP